MYPELRTSGTLKSFLNGISIGWPWENNSSLAELSKAAALLEQATRLASSWRPELPNAAGYYAEFIALDTRIEEFKAGLTPVVGLSVLPLAAHCEPRRYATIVTLQVGKVFLCSQSGPPTSSHPKRRIRCDHPALVVINAIMIRPGLHLIVVVWHHLAKSITWRPEYLVDVCVMLG